MFKTALEHLGFVPVLRIHDFPSVKLKSACLIFRKPHFRKLVCFFYYMMCISLIAFSGFATTFKQEQKRNSMCAYIRTRRRAE